MANINYVNLNGTTRYLEDTEARYFANVKTYGATGDGVTDDTAAIQAALNAGKKKVIFPQGTYICNGATIRSNSHLIGYGAKLVCTDDAYEVSNIFRNNASGTTGGYGANANIIIEGFDFSAPDITRCTCVGFIHCSNITIRDCIFHDTLSWHMVEINSCRDVLIDNCRFYNYGEAESGYTEMLQLDFANAANVFPWAGPYDGTVTRDVVIRNCSFIGTASLVSASALAPAGIGNHTSNTSAKIQKVRIEGCYFENLGTALKFVNAENLTFQGNHIEGCETGCYFTNYAARIHILDNVMAGNEDYSTSIPYGKGVYFKYTSDYLMREFYVSGNRVKNFGSTGIFVQGMLNHITGNDVVKCGADGILAGYDEFGSFYEDNQAFENNAASGTGFADFKLYHHSVNRDTPGDVLVSTNKFSAMILKSDAAGSSKSLIFNNHIKNTLTNSVSDGTVALSDNTLSKVTTMGASSTATISSSVTVDAQTWTTVASITGVSAGFYAIEGYVAYAAATADSGTLRCLVGDTEIYQRSSFIKTTVSDGVFYAPITTYARVENDGGTISMQVWSRAGATYGTTERKLRIYRIA